MGSGEFTGIKELDDLSQEIAQLQRYQACSLKDTRHHLFSWEQLLGDFPGPGEQYWSLSLPLRPELTPLTGQ